VGSDLRQDDVRRAGFRPLVSIGAIVLLVVFFGVSLYFFGSLRHAQLGLIDDHEILRFLGPDHRISLTDIPGVLFNQTEVGRWGHANRLRPLYYLFRIVEASLWKDDAGLWYLTRMALVALTAALIALAVLRGLVSRARSFLANLVGFALALIAGLLVLSLPAWADIANRLGPSEIYVSLGVALFVVGVGELWRRPSGIGAWIIVFVGYLVIVGSKEDGVLFLVPLAVVYLLLFRRSARPWLAGIFGVVSVLFTAYVTIGILLGTASTGEDMYGNSRSVGLFVRVMVGSPLLGAALAFLVLTAAAEFLRRRSAGLHTGTRLGSAPAGLGRVAAIASDYPLTLSSIACVYLILGDGYFYQNYYAIILTSSRYGFLTDLSVVLGFVLLMAAAIRLPIDSVLYRVAIAAGAIMLFLVTPLVQNVHYGRSFHVQSAILTDTSVIVDRQIQAGVAALAQHPGSQAVLLAANPLAYERVFALPQFLAYYGSTTHGIGLSRKAPPRRSDIAAPLDGCRRTH
jgi:hypothetical protein